MSAMIEHLPFPPAGYDAATTPRPVGAAITLSPDFELRFLDTWFAGIVKAGIEHIQSTEPVGQDGARAMFWSAVSKALSDHLRKSAVFSYELDREMSPEELARLRELYPDVDPEIPF